MSSLALRKYYVLSHNLRIQRWHSVAKYWERKQSFANVLQISYFKTFAIFNGKHLCWSLFSKVAVLKTCNFIKKRLQHRCFPVNIVKVLGIPYFRTPPVAASVGMSKLVLKNTWINSIKRKFSTPFKDIYLSSSSGLQKKHSYDSTFLNLKSILFT